MIGLIYFEGGEKHCRQIKTREEYISVCNTPENIRNWQLYRQTGENKYKLALVQVNYNCQVPEGGLLKGIRTVSPFFFTTLTVPTRRSAAVLWASWWSGRMS